MNKLLSLLVCLAFLVGLPLSAFAGSYDREDADEAGYVLSKGFKPPDGQKISAPTYVWAVTLQAGAGSGSSYLALHNGDSASDPVGIEIEEATQYDCRRLEFSKPIYFKDGVYVDFGHSSDTCVIEYR